MRRRWVTAVLAGALILAAGPAGRGDDARPKVRNYVGSIQVPAERRAEVLKLLKAKGFAGAYVPDGASADAVMYRGPKAEYDSALETVNRHLHPEWYQAGGAGPAGAGPARPRGGARGPAAPNGKTDDAIFDQLKLTDKQKTELADLRKWMKEATAEMKKLERGHIEEGMKINKKWREGLARILTDEQHKAYMKYWTGP